MTIKKAATKKPKTISSSAAKKSESSLIKTPIFVTGLSGAGMSSALKIMEDLGYEVFDNFPVLLIDALLGDTTEPHNKPIVIGLDTRTRGFNPQSILQKTQQWNARLVFLTCDESRLQERFTETRRIHPMATDRPVGAGIKRELAWLHPLKMAADPVVDTSKLTIHTLKRVLKGYFSQSEEKSRLNITVLSFGFKNGLPREADIVMDVRFLKNPHWDETLRPLTGQDKSVQQFIAKDKELKKFINNFKELLEPLFGRYAHEGKSYLTLAIGCTGGKHRSVYVSEMMGAWIRDQGLPVTIEHRDMNRL